MVITNFVVLQLIVLLAWPAMNNLAAEPSLSKPGCQETCGEFTIPFPFGIGNKSCFHDKWFEIVCQKSTNVSQSVPFLKNLNLEVLKIILPSRGNIEQVGQVYVKSPIISSHCNNGSNNNASTGPVVDLTGSSFEFSQIMNRFAAVGRNIRAVMTSIEPEFIGCMPRPYGDCFGESLNCCETSIPLNLKVFSVDFESMGGDEEVGEECKFALTVSANWLYGMPGMSESWEVYNSSTILSVLQTQNIPAVISWTLSDWEGWGWVRDTASCGNSVDGSGDPTTLFCYCDDGFEGNPYIVNGCVDINECKDVKLHGCPDACENTNGGYKCRYSRLKQIIIALGSVLGLLFLITGVWRLYNIIKRRRKIKMKKKFFKRNGGLLLKQQLSSCEGSVENKLFTSRELEKATDNFNENRILGQGGQGTVYKGMLSDGRIVAVKKSKIEDQGEIETFINEVVILSQIIHRNVVKLLGCCLETEVPLLVYEFIPNGTLSQYLHDQNEITVSWEMRLQIAIEVAAALSYLHSKASVPIFHRDIKSANILLDDKYRAKVADFGTSRSVSIDQTHLTTLVYGTFGYLDPEYFQSSQFTEKSDVYSFGVVLVELLTGQKAISLSRIEEGRGLAAYFIMEMEENHLFDIVDTKIVKQGKEDEIVAVSNLAKRCLFLNGRNRPAMREVHMELERIGLLQKVFDGELKEVDSITSQETENWDTFSAPSKSGFVASSTDEEPLVFNQTW